MDIIYQYYNEIVLFFKDYDIDFKDGIIIINVPTSDKPFDNVCEKIYAQLLKLSQTLDARDKEILIKVERNKLHKEFLFDKEN